MARLIDADELMRYLYDNYESDCCHYEDDDWSAGSASAWWTAFVHVKDTPIVDAIPINWLRGLLCVSGDSVDKVVFDWIKHKWNAEKDDL